MPTCDLGYLSQTKVEARARSRCRATDAERSRSTRSDDQLAAPSSARASVPWIGNTFFNVIGPLFGAVGDLYGSYVKILRSLCDATAAFCGDFRQVKCE